MVFNVSAAVFFFASSASHSRAGTDCKSKKMMKLLRNLNFDIIVQKTITELLSTCKIYAWVKKNAIENMKIVHYLLIYYGTPGGFTNVVAKVSMFHQYQRLSRRLQFVLHKFDSGGLGVGGRTGAAL